MKEIAVTVEFAEKVAIARTRFKNSEISQMDLDWHESKWKTFPQTKEINILLDELTNEITIYWGVNKKLRANPASSELFLQRATISRKISTIRHKLFLKVSDVVAGTLQ